MFDKNKISRIITRSFSPNYTPLLPEIITLGRHIGMHVSSRKRGLKMRHILFLCLLWSVAMSAQAEFAPGVVNHVPTEEERTKSNSIRSETICEEKHGEWLSGEGYAYCVLPYADAGKICKSSKDCLGHCIAPVTDKPIDHGTCQIDDSADDCGRPQYENGKIIYFNCD